MSKYQILDTGKKFVVGEAVILGKYTTYFLFKDISFTKTVETKNFMRTFGKRIKNIYDESEVTELSRDTVVKVKGTMEL